MKVLILGEQDVRDVLDMESCIAAMEDALAALARDELFLPLRFIMRPPAESMFGLMPAYRGGDDPVFSLKEIVVSPGNSAHGLDPHQGAVILHDGRTGLLRAVLNASAVTEIRTAAVSAVATKRLARPGARVVAVLGSGVQGRSHVQAMQAIVPTRSCGSGAGTRRTRRRSPSSRTRSSAPRPRKPWTAPRSSAPRPPRVSRSSAASG